MMRPDIKLPQPFASWSIHYNSHAIFDRLEFLAPGCKLCELIIGHFFRWPMVQQKFQISVNIQVMRLCHLNHCIHNSAGGSSFRTGTEQPVLPADSEWPDCILAKIIGQTAMTVFQISHQGVFPILGIVYRFRQTGSFVWALLIQPIPECL